MSPRTMPTSKMRKLMATILMAASAMAREREKDILT
jgi:hypothetical protein